MPIFSSAAPGMLQADCSNRAAAVQVTISAVDDQTLQTLHSRALYHGGSIRWGHAFEVRHTCWQTASAVLLKCRLSCTMLARCRQAQLKLAEGMQHCLVHA